MHQFLSKKSEKKEKIGEIQKSSQFTVSEIIGFLNEFETPAWVYERMFQQSEHAANEFLSAGLSEDFAED